MSTDIPSDDTGAFGDDASIIADPATSDDALSDGDGVFYDDEVTPEHGILGFTLRELLIGGVWLVMFALSFVPLGWGPSLWQQGISWLLPVGAPTVAVFLLVLRRFSPEGIRRVGSLGVDQFASVTFSVAAVWWAQQLWEYVAVVIRIGADEVIWISWVQFLLALVLVALTVVAPLIPGLREDFRGRLVTLAHRNANPVRPVIARPRPLLEPRDRNAIVVPEEVPADASEGASAVPLAEPQVITTAPTQDAQLDVELSGLHATDEVARSPLGSQVRLTSHASAGGTGTEETTVGADYVPSYSRSSRRHDDEIVSDTGSIEALMGTSAVLPTVDVPDDHEAADDVGDAPLDADAPTQQTDAFDAPSASQPFWILAPTDRDVHDDRGEPIFRIGPGAWALVLEDRGGAYVVRLDDGRIGYLHDIADITKG